MDERAGFPRAADGLFILFAASIVSNLGSQLYYWGIAPVMGPLIAAAGSILLIVGLYRAGRALRGPRRTFEGGDGL